MAPALHMQPFVLPVAEALRRREGILDVYRPVGSDGGLLTADWLTQPPSWLRCIAATYPILAPLTDWNVDARFRPVDAVRGAGQVPILLTRVGRERAEVTATIEAFTAAADAHHVGLEVIDVPDGQQASTSSTTLTAPAQR